jgi:hypothetical protein
MQRIKGMPNEIFKLGEVSAIVLFLIATMHVVQVSLTQLHSIHKIAYENLLI